MDDSNNTGCGRWLAIGASVATIIGLGWAIFTYFSSLETRPEGYTPQSYQSANTRQPTYTPYPTYTPHPQPTNTIEVYGTPIVVTRVVAPGETVPTMEPAGPGTPIVVVKVVTAVPTATSPPTSTPTPRPTSTPTPENTIFKDDFNNGLGAGWQVLFGNPMVVDDRLTATEETWLIAGNSSWTNYEVRFDYETKCGWYNHCHALNGVRVQDADNMVAFKWACFVHTWQMCEDGQCTIISEDLQGGVEGWVGSMIVTVSGNKVSARVGSTSLGSFHFDGFSSGKVLVGLDKRTWIDNFRVVPLD